MKFVRISADVWVNLDEIESVTRNENGTALLQGRQRIYESQIPFEAILMQASEASEKSPEVPEVNSPLLAETRPAW